MVVVCISIITNACAGDVVKKWNLRYFVLIAGPQPLLVYYRKVILDSLVALAVGLGH